MFSRLRYDGPVLLDDPNSPEMYTVIDPTHHYFRFTLGMEELLKLGFTEREMVLAKLVNKTT